MAAQRCEITRCNMSDLFTKGVSKETFLALEGFLAGREPISKLFEAISRQMEQGNESTQQSPCVPDTPAGRIHLAPRLRERPIRPSETVVKSGDRRPKSECQVHSDNFHCQQEAMISRQKIHRASSDKTAHAKDQNKRETCGLREELRHSACSRSQEPLIGK